MATSCLLELVTRPPEECEERAPMARCRARVATRSAEAGVPELPENCEARMNRDGARLRNLVVEVR